MEMMQREMQLRDALKKILDDRAFERLANMIRERGRINGRLRALTAQGKLQAAVISIMPLILLFLMFKIAPQMMSHFFNSILGMVLITAVIVLEILGFFVIKKITTIDV